MIDVIEVLEPRVLELMDECVDGKGWGWGGMMGGIDDGGDAVVWVEETEGRRGGGAVSGPGVGNCGAGMGNGMAMGNEGDVDLSARDNAVLE